MGWYLLWNTHKQNALKDEPTYGVERWLGTDGQCDFLHLLAKKEMQTGETCYMLVEYPLPESEPIDEIFNIDAMYDRMIKWALQQTGYVQSSAAKLLGITPRTLSYHIGRLGIKHETWRKNRE